MDIIFKFFPFLFNVYRLLSTRVRTLHVKLIFREKRDTVVPKQTYELDGISCIEEKNRVPIIVSIKRVLSMSLAKRSFFPQDNFFSNKSLSFLCFFLLVGLMEPNKGIPGTNSPSIGTAMSFRLLAPRLQQS
ncbi:hypothetical protein CEXT_167971 [Caerostris extrusa]|uniref:Uncharacterized protein n=1 Tax=Caerostris extrusa TaxID=172846 RepID=A0AAV4PUE2_CAEEX|nr:hypothetical protein CEXT_167971 [Caerostris extrusa]